MSFEPQAQEDDFKAELNRRLKIISSPDYDDPAMVDISMFEVALWFLVATAIFAASLYLWLGGY